MLMILMADGNQDNSCIIKIITFSSDYDNNNSNNNELMCLVNTLYRHSHENTL